MSEIVVYFRFVDYFSLLAVKLASCRIFYFFSKSSMLWIIFNCSRNYYRLKSVFFFFLFSRRFWQFLCWLSILLTHAFSSIRGQKLTAVQKCVEELFVRFIAGLLFFVLPIQFIVSLIEKYLQTDARTSSLRTLFRCSHLDLINTFLYTFGQFFFFFLLFFYWIFSFDNVFVGGVTDDPLSPLPFSALRFITFAVHFFLKF